MSSTQIILEAIISDQANGSNLIEQSQSISQTPAPGFSPTSIDDAWHAVFFDNNDLKIPFVYERDDAAIAFDWESANPAPNVSKDNFSVHWEKCAQFEERYYLFTGSVGYQDKLRVYVDDIEVMNIYGTESSEEQLSLSEGIHCITVEFIERNNDAYVYLDFE